MSNSSRFSSVETLPLPENVLILGHQFVDDPSPEKVNLLAGVYKTEEGISWVLPLIRRLEQGMAADNTLLKDYLPATGFQPFSSVSTKLLLGADSPSIKEGRALGIQCISAAGALRVGAEILVRLCHQKVVYASDPSWGGYKLMFLDTGFESYRTHRYWDAERRCLDFGGMMEDLRKVPENSTVLLQACAHNPTGFDPTKDQWRQIADVMEERNLIPFFDLAYHGMASGDLDEDAWPVRYFDSRGFEMLCAQCYSKNFGLYSERVGNLVVVTKDSSVIEPLTSQVYRIIRASYAHPPAHGARIVTTTLNDPALMNELNENLQTMRNRIISMRQALRERLEKLGTPGTWHHITEQTGMFIYSGISSQACQKLVDDYRIYLTIDGRINVSGLNPQNIDRVAECIHKAVLET